MCNQAVSLVAAELERQGVTTVVIQLILEVARRVGPPRALFVPFAHGYPLAAPNSPERQHHVLEAALGLVEDSSLKPRALVELPSP